MANYMLIRHKVRDFPQWKQEYDAHLPRRDDAGLVEKYLLRGTQDSNEVVLMFEAQDLGRAMSFADSTEVREIMQKAGVIDQPDIYFLND